MKIIDLPIHHNLNDYKKAIDQQLYELSKLSNVVSVYQIGSVSTPGISDIDLLVVFQNNSQCAYNPKGGSANNYLYTHTLYGCSEQDFLDSFNYTFFHNHKLLYGKEFEIVNRLAEEDQKILKEQIALEFLVKMYINLVLQKAYNTIKLRALFLHIKALIYDFEFLNIKPEQLIALVNEGVSYRNNWFNSATDNGVLKTWFEKFYHELATSLKPILQDNTLYFPLENFHIAPNIEVCKGEHLQFNRSGLWFPDIFGILGKRYFNVLNRFNNFKITIPLVSEYPTIVKEYFDYVDKSSANNAKNFPHFMPLTSSLKVYKRSTSET